MDEEEILIHEKNSKDHLERVRNRVQRKEWSIFKSKLSRNPAKVLTGWKRWQYQRKLDWYKFKMSYQDFVSQAELWSSSFKAIEGYFGSGVLAYFRFLKWLLQMNIVIMLLWLAFVVIPESAMVPESLDEFVGRNMADFHSIEVANICSSRFNNENNENNVTSFVGNLIHTLEGTGWMARSLMFYGMYSDTYLTSSDGSAYNLTLAYICVTIAYLLISLFMMCVQTGDTLKLQILTGWKMKTFRAYSNIVFAGWDFALIDPKAAELRHYNLNYEICSSIEEDRDTLRRSKLTFLDKLVIFFRRCAVNLFVFVVLGVAGWLIFYTQNQMASRELDPDFPNLSALTQLLIKYVPPITITALNGGIPVIFTFVVQFEDYKPDGQIQITLIRTVFLRLASLVVLMGTLYRQVTCKPVDECNIGIAPDCPKLECWETFVGEQFYKLVVINFFVQIAVAFFYELPRRLVVNNFKNKLTNLIGLPQFQIPKNVLDLVFLQCLGWIGAFFSPMLPVLVVIELIFIFYIKRFTTMNNYVPSKRPYRASMANVFFMIVLMTSFILCCIPIGYMAGVITPSRGCGPFRAYDQQYSVISRAIDKWPEVPRNILLFIRSPPVLMLAFLILCIILYFYHATSGTKQELIDLLREQMTEESRDKQFLLMRLNEVTGESSHGSGSSKKGQLSRLAKPQGTEGTTTKSDPPPSYDSMGSTITKTE